MNKLTLIFLFLISFSVFSQSAMINNISNMQWFDNIVGIKNTGLVNGVYHIEKYKTNDGFDQYYKSPNFMIGNLLYDNQEYFNVNLLYDIYSDDLIFGFYENELLLMLKLVRDKVGFFSIDDKRFVRLLNEEYNIKGFYEILFRVDKLALYIKHKKQISKRLGSEGVYYEFKKKSNYILCHKHTYHKVDNKKSITKLFPEKRKLINSYFLKYNYLNESNRNQFMINLFNDVIIP